MSHVKLALALAFIGIAAARAQPASAPELAYRSALEGYKPFAEQPVAPWRESNDSVRAAGGWRAYAREAQGAAAPASAASSPHVGHH